MDSHNLHNTISHPTVVSDGQDNNLQQNVAQINPATPSETSQPHTSADSEAQQPFTMDNDVQMDTTDYDDMPDLQEISDSSDSEDESESDRDANEVEMQAVDHTDHEDGVSSLIDVDVPQSNPSSLFAYRPSLYATASRSSSNRRARVDDDEDEERDRRHPSQRVSSNNRNNTSATSSSSQTPAHLRQNNTPTPATPTPHIHRHIIRASFNVAGGLDPHNNLDTFRIFQHLMMPPTTSNSNATPTQNNNPSIPHNDNAEGGAPQPTPPQQPQQPGNNEPRINGVALSFEIGPGFPLPQGGTPQPGRPAGEPAPLDPNGQPIPIRHEPFVDILGLLGRLGGGIDGETVFNFGNLGLGMHQEKDDPERAKRLVAGLEVVPAGLIRRLERVGGAGGGKGEEPTNGGDAGCAICWDKLLDADGEGFGKEETDGSPEAGSSTSETAQPKIVSLPCAHVFHADCLLPWFARPRHTTCPTCRFNIDPENLTHASIRRRERRERAAARRAEDAENPNEGEAPGPEVLADADMDGDAARLPAFLEMMGASGELLTPEEVEMENRQMVELLARMRGDAAVPPPPPPGLLARSRVVRAQSAPQESLPHRAEDTAPAEANPTPTTTETNTATPFHLAPTAPAAGTPPRLPAFLQTPHGAVGILPVPVMIPVSIPASAHATAGNHTADPHTPQNARLAQPRTEGHLHHLLSRVMARNFPVPFNLLFPGLPLNRLQQQPPPTQRGTPQPATPGNAPGGGPIPGNYIRYNLPFNFEAYRPRTSFPVFRSSHPGPQFFGTHIIDPLNLQNLPRMTHQPRTPSTNAANPLSDGQAAPREANANPPNMPLRDVMEVRVDMVFGPGGAFPFPTGNRQGGAERQQGLAPAEDEADAFMQRMEEQMAREENGQGDANDNGRTGIDNLRHEVEGRLFDVLNRRQRADAEPAPAGEQTPGQQPGQATATPQQPGQQQQSLFGDLNPAFLAGLNTGMGMHFTGTGRSVAEAFSQMFGGMRAQQQQQGQAAPAGQQAEGEQQAAEPAAEGNPQQPPPQQQQTPPVGGLPPGFTAFGMFPNLADLFGGGIPERRAPRSRKDWTLPAAPGPTLRQRIERREREAGLRCCDISCGIGPSDEDPFGTESGAAAVGMKQVSIMSKEDESELCSHTFHSPCLVSAERVAQRGADAIVEDGNVEVSCPVCRGTGCVSKADWDEGVVALL